MSFQARLEEIGRLQAERKQRANKKENEERPKVSGIISVEPNIQSMNHNPEET